MAPAAQALQAGVAGGVLADAHPHKHGQSGRVPGKVHVLQIQILVVLLHGDVCSSCSWHYAS